MRCTLLPSIRLFCPYVVLIYDIKLWKFGCVCNFWPALLQKYFLLVGQNKFPVRQQPTIISTTVNDVLLWNVTNHSVGLFLRKRFCIKLFVKYFVGDKCFHESDWIFLFCGANLIARSSVLSQNIKWIKAQKHLALTALKDSFPLYA